MSNLLEQASLVMIPSGYKEDIVYSEIPINGSGDLQFTRSSNGTRINSSGLVEVCPWNLLQQSETFNTTWSASNTVVTANQTTAPNGTTTADLVVDNTNNTSHALTQSVTNLSVGLDYYYSIYVKNNNHTWVLLRHDNGGTFNYFNIATGVKGTNTQANSTIENVGNGWYKLTVPFNVTGSSSGPEFYLASADGTFTYAGTGTGVYIWGASYTLSAKPYFPTTDRLNVPRLTYQNGGGGCPSLLLEKQSTNLALYSEQFDNANWIKLNGSVTANTSISPDGTQNADSFIPNTTSGVHVLRSNLFNQSATASHSWFVKANGYTKIAVRESELVGNYATFNLSTGTLISTNQTASIENLGNGWYRCTLVDTTTGANAQTSILVLPDSYTSGDPIVVNWSGDGTKGVFAWGAQVEISGYPTSYIPTTSSSATRVADACSKTGISSLIGQTEGTALLDFQFNGEGESIIMDIAASGLSPQNRIILYQPSATIVQFIVLDNNVAQVSIASSSYSVGQRLKVGIAYKSNDFAFYINGVQIGVDSSGSVPATSRIDIGNRQDATFPASISVNQFYLSKTRLTNAELASLTTI